MTGRIAGHGFLRPGAPQKRYLSTSHFPERQFRKRGQGAAGAALARWKAMLGRQNADLAVTLGGGGLQASCWKGIQIFQREACL